VTIPGNSATCRYRDGIFHTCLRRDGRVLSAGEECFAEASQSIADAIVAERALAAAQAARCLKCQLGYHGECEGCGCTYLHPSTTSMTGVDR